MSDKYEAWFVDVATLEHPLAETTIAATSENEAIVRAEEWAKKVCQEVGEGVLILKRPGEPGNIHSKRFDPLAK
ncbi:hypothetical protein E4K64_19065 [Bradyrhizobium frederickii]|uniref:Uncharacterized protein n=1 Tax=Bradyrhizobium frederickii TaxID=2560054 RepID=A0A4Y9P6R2_9BRAD|nr:hypothetical protein [Bradyrhizobium frederickii]TFV74095.1 hypothetical protein E4K64_19065 [Bradyrhizobium frederickii]